MIGTITNTGKVAGVGPIFYDEISFAGDAAYAAGGTPGFLALVRAKTAPGRTILAVIAQDCGGYVPSYISSTDKLKVYRSAGAAAPMAEVPGATDLSAVPFSLTVITY
jgi:hypothetical protein